MDFIFDSKKKEEELNKNKDRTVFSNSVFAVQNAESFQLTGLSKEEEERRLKERIRREKMEKAKEAARIGRIKKAFDTKMPVFSMKFNPKKVEKLIDANKKSSVFKVFFNKNNKFDEKNRVDTPAPDQTYKKEEEGPWEVLDEAEYSKYSKEYNGVYQIRRLEKEIKNRDNKKSGGKKAEKERQNLEKERLRERKNIEKAEKKLREENRELEQKEKLEKKRLEAARKKREDREREEKKRLEREKEKKEKEKQQKNNPQKDVVINREGNGPDNPGNNNPQGNGNRGFYNADRKREYEESLRRKGFRVPANRDKLVQYRSAYMEEVQIPDETAIGGFRADYVWKAGTDPFLIEAYDWIYEYFSEKERVRERKYGEKMTGRKELAGNMKSMVNGVDGIYEGQDTCNCYCCTGTAMLNTYLSKRYNRGKPVRTYNQYDMRNYVPEFKPFDEEKLGVEKAVYDEYKAEIRQYAGEGRHGIGDVFELGDFFLNSADNIQLNRMQINLPRVGVKNEELICHNLKVVVLNKIKQVLDTGNVVGVLIQSPRHYMTIVGMDGENIKYLDSNKGDPQKIRNTTIEEGFLFRLAEGHPVVFNWLSDLESPEALKRKYSNLDYDERQGFSAKETQVDSALYLGQTKGVVVSKNPEEVESGYAPYVNESVYIPKKPVYHR